jgi:signal transduction histidine kinase
VSESDKVKILLVDDQQAKLLSYEVVLAQIGETLIKASSAHEAFECLLKNDIALILIDVCMPDLNGFELARMIREHPRFQRTGIIFVSAVMTTNLDQLRGYELGAFDYVPVPVVPEVLRAKVKVFVDLHRKTRHLERLNAELEQRVLERTGALRRFNEQLERRIEERTRQREKALEQLFEAQKMDTIGQLTGEVAHDFNNLLMSVLGSLKLLQRHQPEDVECRGLLHNAVQGAERGASLARRLLAFSRRQELKPESVDIGELVSGMEDLLTRALGFDIELECQFPSTLPPVLVDANQLELALLNVALNARDAMPGGGRLVISALEEIIGSGAADISLPPGAYVRIRVVDTGTGMDEATRAKATEPFFTTKTPGLGTGLGLSVVHGIATQSSGMLRINSAPNIGTTVELLLPQSSTWPVSAGRKDDNLRSSPGVNAL